MLIDGSHTNSLSQLFEHLFQEPSRDLIKSSFISLQQSVTESLSKLDTYELTEIRDYLMKTVISPVHQLFVDLGDLEYKEKCSYHSVLMNSDELRAIVQDQSYSFFSAIQTIPHENESSILAYGYAFYLLESSAREVASSFQFQFDEILRSIQEEYMECIHRWITALLTPSSCLDQYFQNVRWTMRDHGISL